MLLDGTPTGTSPGGALAFSNNCYAANELHQPLLNGAEAAFVAPASSEAGGKVHFSSEKDDVSLYGTPKEEMAPPTLSQCSSRGISVSSDTKPGWVRNQLQNMFQPTDNKLAMKLFGSKKALIQERVRQKAAGHWIIHPCSSFR